MRRFAKFLKDTLAATDLEPLSAASCEVTLHDALRIGAGRLRNENGPAGIRPALRRIDVCRYRSESDLQQQWRGFDEAARRAGNLSVVLALDDFLRGNLRELIRRRSPAHRLVIVPRPGHWPGVDSFGDLALAPSSLGWGIIEICRDLESALESAIAGFGQDERLLVVLPARTASQRAV